MRRSKMNGKQLAFLDIAASSRKPRVFGRWAATEAVDPATEAKRTSYLLDRDAARRRELEARESMASAIASYDGPMVKLPAGKAYGANELTKVRATAMPMQYFRKGGSIG